jgi:hypothetical protein
MDYLLIVSGLAFTALFVLVTRLLGAWMLRINEVISNQKIIIEEGSSLIQLLYVYLDYEHR